MQSTPLLKASQWLLPAFRIQLKLPILLSAAFHDLTQLPCSSQALSPPGTDCGAWNELFLSFLPKAVNSFLLLCPQDLP